MIKLLTRHGFYSWLKLNGRLFLQARKEGKGEKASASMTSVEEADEAKRKEKRKRDREVCVCSDLNELGKHLTWARFSSASA